MDEKPILETERLILRQWRDDDIEPFAAMNADPRVTAALGVKPDPSGIRALIERIATSFRQNGFGLWAVEVRGGMPFIGFTGLSIPRFEAPFMPAVEVGWRLAFDHWGKGYATEGAKAALNLGFHTIGLEEIVSFASVANTRSHAVMKRLGMRHDPQDDFDYPGMEPTDPLCRHLLHRLKRVDWHG
jgi:RimJ/RimL family protein N-acetyltransferase